MMLINALGNSQRFPVFVLFLFQYIFIRQDALLMIMVSYTHYEIINIEFRKNESKIHEY